MECDNRKESTTQAFMREYVFEDKEGLEQAAKQRTESTLHFEDFALTEEEKEFFSKEKEKGKFEKYKHLARLVAVLRPLHAAIETILKLGETKVKKEVLKMTELVTRVFRHLYKKEGNTDPFLRTLMLRFVQVADILKLHELSSAKSTVETVVGLLFFLLGITSEILKMLIHKIENGTEEELRTYDRWIENALKQLTKIVNSPLFHLLLASASGGGFAVIGPYLILAALGFTTTGIQVGSFAAAWMSAIGTVSSGSLFAALQSAGVVGLGGLATGGLAVGGAVVGASIYGIVKLATMEKIIDVKVRVQGKSKLNEPRIITCSSKMKIQYFLEERLTEALDIPEGIQKLGVKVYEEKKPHKTITMKQLRDHIVEIGNVITGYLLLVVVLDENSSIDLPFYLQREQRRFWTIRETPLQWF